MKKSELKQIIKEVIEEIAINEKEPIILTIWYGDEMAEISQGGEQLDYGNFWDFHPGCSGTKFLINGKWVDLNKQWNESIRGPEAVAKMVAKAAGAKLIIKKHQRKSPEKPP